MNFKFSKKAFIFDFLISRQWVIIFCMVFFGWVAVASEDLVFFFGYLFLSDLLSVEIQTPVVRANLQHAFPEKDLSEIIKIEKRYYRHLCDFFVEMYKMWHMSDEQIRRRCKFTNPEVIRRYFDQGKSVIGVLGHYGNWELDVFL